MLLRGLCCLYAGPGAAIWQQSSSEFFEAGGTILACCPSATSVAKLLLFGMVREVSRIFPLLRCRNVVDDLMLRAIWGECLVTEKLPAATALVLKRLSELQLPAENSKCGVVVSTSGLG